MGSFWVVLSALVVVSLAAAAPGVERKTDNHGLRDKLGDLVKQLKDIKEPARPQHETLQHPKIHKPTDQEKHVSAEERLKTILEFMKSLQGQQMVLGSALHTVMERVAQENDQIDDQQSILAKSFVALFENVATRQDLEEISTAAGEDNDLHLELEDTSKKVQDLVKHLGDIQGHPEEDGSGFDRRWKALRAVMDDSSLDSELDHIKEVIATLKSHSETSSSKLFYFIMINLSLLLGILLWSRAKSTYTTYR